MTERTDSVIGRAREMTVLEAGLERAKIGEGALFALVGEAGIGKTRLATEVARLATEKNFVVAWGRCAEAADAPAFWPWIQVLRSLRRALKRGRAPDAEADAAAALDATLDRLVPELRADSSPSSAVVDPTQARLALFESVLDAFYDVATAERPLLVVLEDLHAADLSSLALMQFLVRELSNLSALVLATYRDVEGRAQPERGEALQHIGREATYLALRRFGREEVRAMLERTAEAVEDAVVDRVLTATDGNALFVEEVARAISSAADAGFVMPAGLRDAIQQRVSKLDPETYGTLSSASVLGRELGVEVTAALLEREPSAIAKQLAAAARAGVLIESAVGSYAFSHVLVHDVLYRALDPRARSELHARAAEVLQSAAEVASHLLLGRSAVGDERAFRGSLEAARRAAETLAFEDAAAIVERALREIPAVDAGLRAESLVVLGDARARLGDGKSGRAACVEAAAIARVSGDATLFARAALACGAEIVVASVDDGLIHLLEAALALLPEDEIDLRARVMGRLAGAEQPATDPQRPITRAREAIALARRSGDQTTLRVVLESAGSALVDYADPKERLPLDDEMRELAVVARDVPSAFRAQTRLTFDHLELGDVRMAVASAEELDRIAATLAWPRLRWTSMMVNSCLAATRGAMDEAHRIRNAAAEQPIDRGDTMDLSACGLALLEDDLETVARIVERRRTDRHTSALTLEMFAILAATERARAGDIAGARAAIEGLSREPSVFVTEPLAIWHGSEICSVLGDVVWANELYPHARALASRFVSWGQYGMTLLYPGSAMVGLLETTMERWDDAFASFEDAERRASAVDALPALAWTLLWHAVARARAGQTERAAGLFERASSIARERNLTRLVTRIDACRGPVALPRAASAPPARAAVAFTLRLDGEVWSLETAGIEKRLKDSRGLRMLARLLAEPGREVHAMFLAGEGADAGDLGAAGYVIDKVAAAAYRERVDDLRDRVAEAERFGNGERASELREELDFLVRELAAGVGLGGRHRKAAAIAERARVNVQRRIRDAIRRIAEQSPELGEYLGWTVRTGNFCAYRPPMGDARTSR